MSAVSARDDMDSECAVAVRRLYGCSWRQAMLSVLCLALVSGAALAWRHHAMFALFHAIVAPGFLACALLLAAARLSGRRLGWLGAAVLLVLGTAAGALAALPCYRLMLAAELKTLQAQIEPHFLYNTLANTRYLARHQPQRAVEMLEHLIAYLHSALPDMRSATSTLGREFELAEHYLALMAIRFGERLQYRLDCPAGLAPLPMPPLLLMTLVENAVRHGVEPKPGPVRIELAASRGGDVLRIVVGDDGAGVGTVALGSGVGLRNLRQRLHALYGARAGFELRRSDAGFTEAVLLLPVAASAGLELAA